MRRKSNRPLISIFIFNAWMWHSALCICLSFTIYMLEGFGSFSILMRFFFLVMLLQMLKISTTNVILVSYTFFSCSLCVPQHLCFWIANWLLIYCKDGFNCGFNCGWLGTLLNQFFFLMWLWCLGEGRNLESWYQQIILEIS